MIKGLVRAYAKWASVLELGVLIAYVALIPKVIFLPTMGGLLITFVLLFFMLVLEKKCKSLKKEYDEVDFNQEVHSNLVNLFSSWDFDFCKSLDNQEIILKTVRVESKLAALGKFKINDVTMESSPSKDVHASENIVVEIEPDLLRFQFWIEIANEGIMYFDVSKTKETVGVGGKLRA